MHYQLSHLYYTIAPDYINAPTYATLYHWHYINSTTPALHYATCTMSTIPSALQYSTCTTSTVSHSHYIIPPALC